MGRYRDGGTLRTGDSEVDRALAQIRRSRRRSIAGSVAMLVALLIVIWTVPASPLWARIAITVLIAVSLFNAAREIREP